MKKNSIFTDARGKVVHKPSKAPMTWRISAYALVIEKNKILMIKDSSSKKWELPGGGVETHETIASGLTRECYEETGFKIAIKSRPTFLHDQFFYNGRYKKFHHTISLVCEGALLNKKQNTAVINSIEVNEITAVAWQPLKTLNSLRIHPMFKTFLSKLKK